MIKGIATAAVMTAGLMAAAPSGAVVTTFASWNAVGNGNFIYANNGTGGSSTTYRSNGKGGSLYTTSSAASVRPSITVPGSINTTFSFLQPAIAPFVSNTPATFTFLASVTNSPVLTFGGFDFEQNLAGSFSFISQNAITIGSHTFAAGSNLLTGTFTSLTIFGQNLATSGSATSSTASGGTITYTSDFLSFTNTNDRDLSLGLTAVTSLVSSVNKGLNFVSTKSFRSFRATANGSFSSDPAPLITALPEPEVWGLMVAGFGMVGLQVRRRRRSATVAA